MDALDCKRALHDAIRRKRSRDTGTGEDNALTPNRYGATSGRLIERRGHAKVNCRNANHHRSFQPLLFLRPFRSFGEFELLARFGPK